MMIYELTVNENEREHWNI